MEDRIWGHVVELEAIKVKEAKDEGVDGKLEDVQEMGNKAYPLVVAGHGHPDGVEAAVPGNEVRMGRDELWHVTLLRSTGLAAPVRPWKTSISPLSGRAPP